MEKQAYLPAVSGNRPPQQNESGSLPWTWARPLIVLALCLGSIAALARLWDPGISSEYDMLMGIYRVMELDGAWRQGVIFPRFGLDLNFTYGTPLFQFYSPLASYVAALFHRLGLGLVEASKAVFTASSLVAGLGAFVYARWLFRSRLAALVTGGATIFAPYLLTVAYERGAMAEGLALALTPWVFFAIHRVVEEDGAGWVWVSSVLVALLVLAHNITALFVMAAVTVYAVILAWRGQRMKRLPGLIGALALGLGLSAFYWLPALAETRFTQMETTMFSGALSAANNLTTLRSLVQPAIVFDYWGPLRFHLALWQAVLGGAALLLLPFQAPRVRLPLALLAAIWLVAMVLQLTMARPFWELVPLVSSIQFPWRLLGLASFCVAMLIGSAFLWRPLQGRLGAVVAAVLIIGIAFVGERALQPDLENARYSITSSQIGLTDLFERGMDGYALFSDYQPEAQRVPSTELALPRPGGATDLAPLAATPNVQVLVEKPFYFKFKVQSDAPFPLRLHRIFFPGWQATVDGEPVPVEPAGQHGLVSADVPAGEHDVVVRYAGTPLQQIAAVISLASLIALVVLLARTRRGRIALGVATGLALALLVLVALTKAAASRLAARCRLRLALQMKSACSAMRCQSNPGTPEIRYRCACTGLRSRRRRATTESSCTWSRSTAWSKVAQVDSDPILSYSPTTRWEPGEVVVDPQELPLDPSTPPGTYRLVVGLYRPDTLQNLAVSDAPTALPGDRVGLGEIEIQAR